MSSRQDLHDLVAAYALDALDELEARRFEHHLEGCSACQVELAEALETTTFLAELSAVPAPPRLKQEVLGRIGSAQRRPNPAWLLAAGAAALALVFGGLWANAAGRLSHAEAVAAVYQAADAVPTVLSGSEGRGRFTYSTTLGRGVFTTDDLDPAPEGSEYELWLIAGDQAPRSAGLFHAGSATIIDDVAPGLVLAVTIEPVGGSPEPEGPVLLSVEL